MRYRLGARPSQAPSARRRRGSGLLWATLAALIAAAGLVAVRRAGPRPVRVTVGLLDPRHAELLAGPHREGDAVIVGLE
jgi:hypothetical protein